MKVIGGYFEIELPILPNYREDQFLFNSGRSALAFILKSQQVSQVLLPYYTCDAVLEPIIKMNIKYSFYSISSDLLPIIKSTKFNKNVAIIVNNYFGLLDSKLKNFESFENVIFDNSQAFYSNLVGGIGAFNSFRKYFGLADGASVVIPNKVYAISKIDRYQSLNYSKHLIGRIEVGPLDFYKEFTKSEEGLKFSTIQRISNLSQRIYNSLNHKQIAKRRIDNFKVLHNALNKYNLLDVDLNSSLVPMIYPLLIKNGNSLRAYLRKFDVFTARYWPNSVIQLLKNSVEYNLTENLVALPVDQRYVNEDMNTILHIVNKWISICDH